MSQAVGDPPRKRQRVTQACQRCRRKKYKCNSVRPTCSTCSASGSECTYGTTVKRRGLQPGYVRALEILWGLVFKKIPGSQGAVKELLTGLSIVLDPATTDGNGNDRADEFLDCWKKSGVPSAIESMLDGGSSNSPRLQNGASAEVDPRDGINPASTEAWSLSRPEQFTETPPSVPSPPPLPQSSSTAAVAGAVGDIHHIDDLAWQSQTQSRTLTWSPLPSDWHNLTQVYLTVEYSWFPILERHALFRIAYTYQEYCDSEIALDDKHRGEFAILWIVLALGETHINGASSPRVDEFKSLSRSFLSVEPTQDQYLSHAQTLLLWSVLFLGCNKLVLAKLMLVQASVLCSMQGSETSLRDVGFQRQRALLISACFVLDTLLSLSPGIRPHMTPDDLPSCTPCDESSSDEWEPYVDQFGPRQVSGLSARSIPAAPSRTSSTYNQLVRLMCILNSAVRRRASEAMLVADVEAWGDSQPSHLKMTVTSARQSTKSFLPPQLHLRAIYIATLMTVASGQGHSQLYISNSSLPQVREEGVHASLLQISQNFGIKALPASVGILVHLLAAQSSSTAVTWSDASPATDSGDAMTEYKDLWGWTGATSSRDLGLIGAPPIMQSRHDPAVVQTPQRLPNATARSDPFNGNPTMSGPNQFVKQRSQQMLVPDPIIQGSSTFTGHNPPSSQQNQQILPLDLGTRGQLDGTLDDIVGGPPMYNDASSYDSGNIRADTPEQLRDYLALLEGNESNGHNQDFMQSLGFFGDLDYTNI